MKVLKKLKNLIATAAFGLMLVAPFAMPASVAAADADIPGQIDKGTCLGSACPTETGETTINNLIVDVVNIFSLIVGVVAVIMIIVGGFKYITSGGESNNVTSAKNTIMYAIIGLVIVALAQFIVRFVLDRVTTT